MGQHLLGLSGTKQSGKTTCVNYVHGIILRKYNVIERFGISKRGKLLVPTQHVDSDGNMQDGMGEIDWESDDYNFSKFCETYVHPHVREFSFAKELKEMCINLLGLTREQCYGTDEQKNTLTNIRWEDMPGNVEIGEDKDGYAVLVPKKTGFMTAREVMQYFGTDIFRRANSKVWTDSGLREFRESGTELGIMSDVRFENELEALEEAGGKTLRFLRRPFTDLHSSETALDHIPHDRFSAVIDNREMDIPEQNKAVHQVLLEWGWV